MSNGKGSASCRYHVVDNIISLSFGQGFRLKLDAIHSVFQLVTLPDHWTRELPFLPRRKEGQAELKRNGHPEQKPPAFDPDDMLRASGARLRGEMRDHTFERRSVAKERANVLKKDAGLREIGHVADDASDLLCKGRHGDSFQKTRNERLKCRKEVKNVRSDLINGSSYRLFQSTSAAAPLPLNEPTALCRKYSS